MCVVHADARLHVWGDTHGSLESVAETIMHLTTLEDPCLDDNFVLGPVCFMAFLGDFVDRGPGSIEVLYTIIRLKVM